MTGRERMLCAIERKTPDVLPVTTHHVMPYYLQKYQGGISIREFFDKFGFDAVNWHVSQLPGAGERIDPAQGEKGFLDSTRIISDYWQVKAEDVADPQYKTVRYTITTPGGELTLSLQSNEYTTWIVEHPIKEKKDMELVAQYVPHPLCDVPGSQKALDEVGERGIVRTHIPTTIDLFGQPGCWQDACCMVGTERLIMETYDDPEWVHELLGIIRERKLAYIRSMKGAAYDIIELGGGDGSSTVISPGIFEEFLLPYDKALIEEAHNSGQRISYHLCGGKMPLLDLIAEMGMDALETLTPSSMGGDADLAVVKRKLGGKMCLIGGFDQNTYFVGNTPEQTRQAVRRCFEQAGEGGGYIIAPSDHFFDAQDDLLHAFVDEAHACAYGG
ncbi:hypothetical protein LJC56_01020 [Christensenellaceae bacterium OttesenSCG-928-K19]|nr:hypothetical protein [Christensenellaceae bacterium OttesenSCG-928-K19]